MSVQDGGEARPALRPCSPFGLCVEDRTTARRERILRVRKSDVGTQCGHTPRALRP